MTGCAQCGRSLVDHADPAIDHAYVAPRPLVIDITEHDLGQPHWLHGRKQGAVKESRAEVATLLMDAAVLIRQAAAKLDTRHRKCSCCGQVKHDDFTEWEAYKRINEVPEKLLKVAESITGDEVRPKRGKR